MQTPKMIRTTVKIVIFIPMFSVYIPNVFVLVLFTAARIIITIYNLLLLVVCSFSIVSKFKFSRKRKSWFFLHMNLMICHLQ